MALSDRWTGSNIWAYIHGVTRTSRRAAWAAVLLVPLALVAATQTAGTEVEAGKAGAVAEPDYAFGSWTEPDVCVLDQTDGMPVTEAVEAFSEVPVSLEVRDSCAGDQTVVVLVIEDETADWAASTETSAVGEPEGEAWLRLNVAHDQAEESWRQLLVHELGHAVGLAHTAKYSVMNVSLVYQLDGLTPADVAVLEALYGQ